MALGDIGKHFPDTDMQWKNADSKKLLLQVKQEMLSRQWEIMNIDATVIAQAPKLASHIPDMCKQIAGILGLDISQVNIKAKTAEKLGPVGQGMSVEAQAVVLIQSAQ
jgi:2-C-methyl-D-erythritol 2,4-cyclodiphosphate synthase